MRDKAGLDAEGLADQIGVTADWYLNLENEEDELEASLDLSQILKLSQLLGVSMAFLLTGDPTDASGPPLSFRDLAQGVRRHLEHSGSVEALEEKIGWDLSAFLKDPEADGWDQRVPFLRDVCGEVGLDWRAVLRYGQTWGE